jgi:ubiquitin-protein ligase E3 C
MMFQSFSGSSRRPRQVNLSGQQPDPFAAWGSSPAAPGIQKTVAVAQAERQHRQQERERLNATKRIQRTWRGHRSRKELADLRRMAWDDMEKDAARNASQISSELAEESRLLLSFFNSQNLDDLSRLNRLGDRLLNGSREGSLSEKDLRPQLLRLAQTILVSLTR